MKKGKKIVIGIVAAAVVAGGVYLVTGGTGGEESDDSLYDAVKLGLENASGTVLGWHLCGKWKYRKWKCQYRECRWN